MTDRELHKKSLDLINYHWDVPTEAPMVEETRSALNDRLAQPEPEPMCKCDMRTRLVGDGCRYCNPQDYIDHLHDALDEKREWVGLTDEDKDKLLNLDNWTDIVEAVEAALRSKNT